MKKSFLFALVASVMFANSSFAVDNASWEITGGLGSGGVGSTTTGTVSSLAIGKSNGAQNSTSVFDLTAGVGYFVMPNLEIMLNGAIDVAHVGGGDSSNAYSFLIGPSFNLLGDVPDALVITPQIGILHASDSNGAVSAGGAGMQYAVTVGKRFKLFDHVSYFPAISYVRSFGFDVKSDNVGEGRVDGTSNFVFTPLQFSIWF